MASNKLNMVTDDARAAERWSAVPSNEPVKAATEFYIKAATECQKHTTEFVTSRLEKDRETLASMMSCKSPAEAMQIQSAWLQEAANDYKSLFEMYSSFVARMGAGKS